MRTHDGKYVCLLSNYLKALYRFKKTRLLLTCAPIYELPSNISTMIYPKLENRIGLQERFFFISAMVLIFNVKTKYFARAFKLIGDFFLDIL